MITFTTRVFPIILAAVALYLSGREWLARGQDGSMARRIRRTLASLVVLIIAWHIWTGELPTDPKNPQMAMELLRHWSKIFLYVLCLVGLAFWDAWDGIRGLRRYLETVERDEVDKIHEQIREKRAAKIAQEAEAKAQQMKPRFIDDPLT